MAIANGANGDRQWRQWRWGAPLAPSRVSAIGDNGSPFVPFLSPLAPMATMVRCPKRYDPFTDYFHCMFPALFVQMFALVSGLLLSLKHRFTRALLGPYYLPATQDTSYLPWR